MTKDQFVAAMLSMRVSEGTHEEARQFVEAQLEEPLRSEEERVQKLILEVGEINGKLSGWHALNTLSGVLAGKVDLSYYRYYREAHEERQRDDAIFAKLVDW